MIERCPKTSLAIVQRFLGLLDSGDIDQDPLPKQRCPRITHEHRLVLERDPTTVARLHPVLSAI